MAPHVYCANLHYVCGHLLIRTHVIYTALSDQAAVKAAYRWGLQGVLQPNDQLIRVVVDFLYLCDATQEHIPPPEKIRVVYDSYFPDTSIDVPDLSKPTSVQRSGEDDETQDNATAADG